jgi:hypothetical protein
MWKVIGAGHEAAEENETAPISKVGEEVAIVSATGTSPSAWQDGESGITVQRSVGGTLDVAAGTLEAGEVV